MKAKTWMPKLEGRTFAQVASDAVKRIGRGVILDAGGGGYGDPNVPTPPQIICGKLISKFKVIRLDIDPAMKPDIVGDILDMPVKANSIDILTCSHVVEHLFPHEVPKAFSEFVRVLKPGGMCFIACPDLQAVAVEVAKGNLEGPLYESWNAGPMTALDTIYGYSKMVAGNPFMMHKTGFTGTTLTEKMAGMGFEVAVVWCADFSLYAFGWKQKEHASKRR